MTSGGFETGSDYVAAKVSIDVDGQGISSLREMSQEIDRLRTATEAGARSSASFTSYIQQMAAAAKQATESHRDLTSAMERSSEMQSRGAASSGSSSQALTSTRLAPGGFVDAFAGMGAGMGGSRSPSPTDVQAQIDPTRQLDPRKYLNAQAGRYNLQSGDLPSSPGQADWGSHANRVAERDRAVGSQQRATSPAQEAGGGQSGQGGSGGDGGGSGGHLGNYGGYGRLASNIANEMRPGGGSWGGVGRALQGGMQGLAKHLSGAASGTGADTAIAAADGGAEAAEGMGIGSLLKGGGIAGGVALGGLAALQKGGAMYQGYKNMGLIRGQGAGAGLGDEAAIRTMALNPFLSTEQSRQIIMAGLTEGYSGKQFDSVTEYMASNLKNMNISVSDSVQQLRKNVNEGGQSIASLAGAMGALKGMSQTGAMSMPDMVANYNQTTAGLISGGASGDVASQQALQGMGVFGDDQVLKGAFNQSQAALGQGPMGGAIMRAFGGANVPPGLDPEATSMWMSDHGGSTGQATGAVYQKIYKMAFNSPLSKKPGSPQSYNALVLFKRLLGMYDPQNPAAQSLDAARDLANKLSNGANPFKEGVDKQKAVTSEVDGPQSLAGDFGGGLENLGTGLEDAGKMFAAGLTGNDEAFKNARADSMNSNATANYNMSAEASSPVMNNVVGQLGANNVEIMDGGKAGALTGSKQQMADLASGKLKWRQKGSTGEGYSLDQTPPTGNLPGGGSGGGMNVAFTPAQVQITVKSDGSASVSPNPLSLNAQAVNQGYGSSTLNNPAQGNGYDRGNQIQ